MTIRITLIVTAMLVSLPGSPVLAQDRLSVLENCTSTDDCINLLEPYIRDETTGSFPDDTDAIRGILKSRFGDEAKYALLDKADSDHDAWRNFASAILGDWGGWTDRDIPKLASVLRRSHGGWIARALGEIGSPAAIEVLVDDLPFAGRYSQTGHALLQIGPGVLDYLLPALMMSGPESEPQTEFDRDYIYLDEVVSFTEPPWAPAYGLIQEFRSQATRITDEWITIATRRRETPERRIGALRGLAAMNGYVGERSADLRSVRRDRNEDIARQAFLTLVAVHDASVVAELVAACQPSGGQWDEYAIESFSCLRMLSEFGSKARLEGAALLTFLESGNPAEQLYAIETLGMIGYADAIPQIESFLQSEDWRHVFAAVRALGHLQSLSSVPAIEAATREHWLWELEHFGRHTATSLVRHQPFTEIYISRSRILTSQWFGDYSLPFDFSEDCPPAVWRYEGGQLTFAEPRYSPENKFDRGDGVLIGTDRGEFGGSLIWEPVAGEAITLVPDNTTFMFEDGDDVITLHGIAHLGVNYGFATLVSRGDNREWSVRVIARFPAHLLQAKPLGDGKFAANSSGRVVIFDRNGIVEAAYCDWRATPEE